MTLAEAKAACSAGRDNVNKNDFQAAEACFRRAVQLYKSASGSLVDSSRALHDLGYCLYEQKNYSEAVKVLNEALVVERTLPPQHKPSLAATLHVLGRCLSDQSEYQDAVRVLQEALELRRTLGFKYKKSTAATLHQLGVCLKEKGSPFDAESILRESLIIKRTAFPNNKTSIANTLYWLARSLMDQQKHDEAINIFEEQLEIEKQLVPVREASTGAARKNLNLCKSMLKEEQAENQTTDHPQAVQNEQHELTVSVSPDSQSSQTLRRDLDDDLVRRPSSQVEQLTLEKEASGEQHRIMRDERDAATRRADELEQEVRSLREEIEEKNDEIDEKNNEIDGLQQRVDTERQSKEALMREKERIQSELFEKDREVRHLSKQKSDLEVLLSAEASVNAPVNLEETDLSAIRHSKVIPKDLVAAASSVGVKWEEFAARLAPVLFSVDRTEQIKEQYGRPFTQCRVMLEEWANSLDRRATKGALIAVMLKMSMRRQANEIFGERLVEHVEIVTVN